MLVLPSDGAENTAAIAAGLALIFVAAASTVLLQFGKNPPQVQTLEYSGPFLSYYINKFKPQEIIQASTPSQLNHPHLFKQMRSNPRFSLFHEKCLYVIKVDMISCIVKSYQKFFFPLQMHLIVWLRYMLCHLIEWMLSSITMVLKQQKLCKVLNILL